ncbi:MAG TPA: DUF72 domain-containing protein [Tepidisphaeraceae bacterium]|nr:DUF72 domain-containing protein [Tepidisphaeraceae bacterium]
MRNVKVGLCGFTISMAEYSRWFPIVEVQQTFYQPSSEPVMRRWRQSVAGDCEFAIKAWQLVTHPAKSPTYRRLKRPLTERERADAGAFRDTAIVEEGWRVTEACATLLNASSILFQCPASFKPTEENAANMKAFFRRIRRPPGGPRLLWEPRGPWPADLVASLCDACDLVHVVDPFVTRTVTSGFTYYRLHGITGTRHVYSDDELRQLRDMLPPAGDVRVLFNNIPRADDARRFGRLLGEGLVEGGT